MKHSTARKFDELRQKMSFEAQVRSKARAAAMLQEIPWFGLHFVHNCIAHPLLFVAKILFLARLNKLGNLLYKFHDITIPDDDIKNVIVMTNLEKEKKK